MSGERTGGTRTDAAETVLTTSAVVDNPGCGRGGVTEENRMLTDLFDELARLAEKDPRDVVMRAGAAAEALIEVDEREPYWAAAARTFLQGLILYVLVHEPPERRSLSRVRELLLEGVGEERKAVVGDAVAPFDMLLGKMTAAQGGPYGDVIAQAASWFRGVGVAERKTVLITAEEGTAFLDGPPDRSARVLPPS